MSIIDKVVAAVMPPESEAARLKAREKLQSLATPGSWLAQILDHHLRIEGAFDAVKLATTPETRRDAQKWLSIILTAHAIAEEAVIYPAMASNSDKVRAEMGYQEQAAAKGEAAALEELDPMSEDYNDKFEHIRGAVAHHMYQEEGTWFPRLQENASPETIARITQRYAEEFDRYLGEDTPESVKQAYIASSVGSIPPAQLSS